MGSFSYQWKRAGSDITDANSVDYTLQVADAGSAITVTVSYTDLGGTPESTSSSAIDAVDGDLDGDSIGDSSDLDIDGDGMLNTYEDANGLNKLDATDRDTDLDGDGVSNYDEFLADSDAMADDYPPVVTPPADVNVDAEGLFTLVTIGSATAVDDLDGDVSVTSDAPTHFAPGENTVTWSATDAAGNTGTATQSVNVTPLVELGKDQVTAEGASATFEVMLNGPAVTYPVTVPYSVSGTALTDGSDHDLVDGSVTITSPNLSTTVTVNVVDDGAGEGMESLIVTLGTPNNAVVGAKATHTLSIYEGNVAPDVSLSAEQGAVVGAVLVEQGGADVVVTATVTDPNPADTHSYDWSGTDNGLTDTDGAGNSTFTFTPATAGTYILQVTATDSGNLTNSAELTLNVVATMPVLTATDSDGDGVDDDVEGAGDSDGDGIPDYLDNANLQGNVLQEMALTEDRYIVETEPGLILTLGSVALRAGEGKAGVSEEEIVSHGNDGAGAVADGEHSYTGGLFDFTVDGLPVAGQSVTIVVPQHAAVPANAVYRKQQSGGWFNFVEDANNTLASALGEEGFCPPPGDAAYSAGLNEGDWCVQLIIEDGGANDADGLANNRVVDPGGVSVMSSTASSSGSGAVQPLWLLLLSSFAVSRVLVQRRGRDKL